MRRLDDLLFYWIFQPFSDWVQWHTGLTCFWLARNCLIASGGCWLLIFLNDAFLGNWINVFICVLAVGFLGIAIYQNEENARAQKDGVLNINRVVMFFSRIIIWFFLLCDNLSDLLLFSTLGKWQFFDRYELILWFYIMSLYFGACTPMPPSYRKVRKSSLSFEVV